MSQTKLRPRLEMPVRLVLVVFCLALLLSGDSLRRPALGQFARKAVAQEASSGEEDAQETKTEAAEEGAAEAKAES